MRASFDGSARLLFLAYFFPPLQSSGSIRTWNIAKYLGRLGWQVRVVTPDPSIWRQVEDPDRVTYELKQEKIQRIPTGHKWRCLSPYYAKTPDGRLASLTGGFCRWLARRYHIEREAGWNAEVEKACSSLDSNDVDVVLASGTPFGSFRVAKRLSDRLGCPYVLDYRDAWSGNPHTKALGVSHEEATLVAHAGAVTTVSPSLAQALRRRFNSDTQVHVISNGYDPEEMSRVEPQNFGHYAIVYTGNFYPPKRVVSPVMAAMAAVKGCDRRKYSNIYFHYYGIEGEHVMHEACRFGVTDHVVVHGLVSHQESLSAVRGASLAVVIASVYDAATLEERGIVTGKLFEALGLGTPLLLIAPDGSDAATVARDSGITSTFVGSNVKGVTSFLLESRNSPTPLTRNANTYAWTHISQRLDNILRQVVDQRDH